MMMDQMEDRSTAMRVVITSRPILLLSQDIRKEDIHKETMIKDNRGRRPTGTRRARISWRVNDHSSRIHSMNNHLAAISSQRHTRNGGIGRQVSSVDGRMDMDPWMEAV